LVKRHIPVVHAASYKCILVVTLDIDYPYHLLPYVMRGMVTATTMVITVLWFYHGIWHWYNVVIYKSCIVVQMCWSVLLWRSWRSLFHSLEWTTA